jgi:hypothetical protein
MRVRIPRRSRHLLRVRADHTAAISLKSPASCAMRSGIAGVTWLAQPFSSSAARPDGVAVIEYCMVEPPGGKECRVPWLPEIAAEGYEPPPGHALQRLVIEIDSGTESQRQLMPRAQSWRARCETIPQPPATHILFLWISTGSIERLNTIWEAWVGHASCPPSSPRRATWQPIYAVAPLGAATLRAGPLPLAVARSLWPSTLTQALGDERIPMAQ